MTRNWEWQIFDFTLNRFSLFFGFEWVMIFLLAVFLARVREKRSEATTSVIYEVFVAYPARGISYLFEQFK